MFRPLWMSESDVATAAAAGSSAVRLRGGGCGGSKPQSPKASKGTALFSDTSSRSPAVLAVEEVAVQEAEPDDDLLKLATPAVLPPQDAAKSDAPKQRRRSSIGGAVDLMGGLSELPAETAAAPKPAEGGTEKHARIQFQTEPVDHPVHKVRLVDDSGVESRKSKSESRKCERA